MPVRPSPSTPIGDSWDNDRGMCGLVSQESRSDRRHWRAMEGYDEATYGDRIADVYDDWYGEITDTAACVDGLRRLAGDGPVLELGVGTGRLAIPLARAGLRVTGVDSSAAMLERLAAKPGGALVETVAGDMADPPVGDRRFSLVFAAYNTLFNLTGPGAQQACFEKVAALLTDGGRFVVEAFVPDADRVGPTDVVVPRQVAADRVVLSVTQSRPGDQTLLGQYIDITEDGIRLRPWHIRYAGPDELDAMASAAGLSVGSPLRRVGWASRSTTTARRTSPYTPERTPVLRLAVRGTHSGQHRDRCATGHRLGRGPPHRTSRRLDGGRRGHPIHVRSASRSRHGVRLRDADRAVPSHGSHGDHRVAAGTDDGRPSSRIGHRRRAGSRSPRWMEIAPASPGKSASCSRGGWVARWAASSAVGCCDSSGSAISAH